MHPQFKQNFLVIIVAADERAQQSDCFLDHGTFVDRFYADYSGDKPDKDSQSRFYHLPIGVGYGPFQNGLRLRLLRFGNRRNGF